MAKINYSPKSLLAFLTAVSFLGWLLGSGANIPEVKQISMPVFIICFGIWLIFIFMSIARNLKK
jgi:hypothetical protein